jgi:hypothetical protein
LCRRPQTAIREVTRLRPLSRLFPDEPPAFIMDCIASGRVRWTCHVTMHLQERRLNSEVSPQRVRHA